MKSLTRHILTTSCLLLIGKPWPRSISHQARMAILQPISLSKSPGDERLYRGLELSNGLKVILVSDSTTDKSSAALDVHVGHMSDPEELPGLAHFLEHMLFLGTEKYPDENEYNQFLSQHGGSSNAYTDTDHTNFYFDIAPQHLEGALDRFAQFFLTPTFTESATDREVKAVNSENEKNLANDGWRQMQLERSMSKEGHAYGKFGTGSADTLDVIPKSKGIDVRSELLAFHSKWYSSNIMALTVVGKDDLDQLEAMVVDKFSLVVNKNVTVPSWPDHPYHHKASKGVQLKVVPIKDLRHLNITFPIKDYSHEYQSKPVSYLSHLVGHEGKGSLLSELKRLGYVNNLVSGLKSGSKGFDFFIVNVDLTEVGIEHTDEIVELTFQYLEMIRQKGIQKWVFEEIQHVNNMLFRFKDKERPMGYARQLANAIHNYPMEEVLSGPWMTEEWKPELIQEVLDCLIPQNVQVMIVSQKFASSDDMLTEKWYGTSYSIEDIPEEKLSAWHQIALHDRLHLPTPNVFIPTDFALVAREEKSSSSVKVPSLLQDTAKSRLWYLQDNEFMKPKACLSIELISPLAYVDPHHSNLVSMFVRLFDDALTEYTYNAEIAGLWYSLQPTKYGIVLQTRGYHQKQDVLLDKIITSMKNFVVDDNRFQVLKEPYIRGLKNFDMEQPHSHASYRLQNLISEKVWTKEEHLDAALNDNLTPEALRVFLPDLLGRMHVEMFAHGNLTPEQAKKLLKVVEDGLGGNDVLSIPPNFLLRYRQAALPKKFAGFYEVRNSVHKSSCIMSLYQVGQDSTRSNMVLELFSQILKEPAFNVLRTQEQLGYIVFSGVRNVGGITGFQVLVQSTKKPRYLNHRIEEFLKSARTLIAEMPEEEIERHKEALAQKKLEKPKKLSARFDKIYAEISSRRMNFHRDEIETEELQKIGRADVLKFFDDFIAVNAEERKKLSTHVISQIADQDEEALEADTNFDEKQIIETNQFKSGLSFYPAVQPFVCLKDLLRP